MSLPVVIVLGFILTSILTWPFLPNLNTLYADWGDYPLVGWILAHNANSILSGRIFDQLSYFNAGQFYPWPYTLTFSEHMFVPSLIFLPIYLLSKHLVFSVNYYTFLTFVLSFTSSFLVLRYFVKNNLAATAGGIVFTFNPMIFAHFPPHLHLLGRFFLPVVFLSLHKFLTAPSLKFAILFFAAFSANALTSIYFQTFSLILLPIFSLPIFMNHLYRKNYVLLLKIFKLLLVGLIFLPFLLYFSLPYLEFSRQEGVVREAVELEHYSARAFDWIVPGPSSMLYGRISKELDFLREPREPNNGFNYSEHTLFLNFIPLVLALFGIFYALKRISLINICFLVLLVASFLLTFGSNYHYFYQFSPIFQAIRVPTRFQIVFYLPFAYFVALGILHLINSSRKWVNISLIILFFLLIAENINLLTYDSTSEIFRFLRSGSTGYEFLRGKNTVHYPILFDGPSMASGYLTWSILTGEKIFNGYSGYAPPDWIATAGLFSKLDEESLKAMRGLNLDYLIIHRKQTVEVVDLSKYAVKKCYFGKDIYIETETVTLPVRDIAGITLQTLPKIVLKNKSNCFLVNKYQDRYKKVDVYFAGQKKSFNIKLPVLIKPFEEVRIGI